MKKWNQLFQLTQSHRAELAHVLPRQKVPKIKTVTVTYKGRHGKARFAQAFNPVHLM